MLGLIVSIAGIYLLFLFWRNPEIDLKWKIVLTILVIIGRFFFLGIGSFIALIIIFLMLRWHGERIR
jgi:hypothetical protein